MSVRLATRPRLGGTDGNQHLTSLTAVVLTVLLLAEGQAGFVGWSVCFGVHFLAHLPRMLRSLGEGWTAARADRTPGSGLRGALLAASLCGGFVPALALLSRIEAWHGHDGG